MAWAKRIGLVSLAAALSFVFVNRDLFWNDPASPPAEPAETGSIPPQSPYTDDQAIPRILERLKAIADGTDFGTLREPSRLLLRPSLPQDLRDNPEWPKSWNRIRFDLALANAYTGAGMADRAIAILGKPDRMRIYVYQLGTWLRARHPPPDELYQQTAQQVLAAIGQHSASFDDDESIYFSAALVEAGDYHRAMTILERVLPRKTRAMRACVREEGRSVSCARLATHREQLVYMIATLFSAGHREEGWRILRAATKPGWPMSRPELTIRAMKATAGLAAQNSNPDVVDWALQTALGSAAKLKNHERRLNVTKKILRQARFHGRSRMVETGLARYRAMAEKLVSSGDVKREDLSDHWTDIARIEALYGYSGRAREFLRKALETAAEVPASGHALLSAAVSSEVADAIRRAGSHGRNVDDFRHLPSNPRRDQLAEIARMAGKEGYRGLLGTALDRYAEEIDELTHPLHKAIALTRLAELTMPRDEVRATEILRNASSLIHDWPNPEERRQVLSDLAYPVVAAFDRQTAADMLGEELFAIQVQRKEEGLLFINSDRAVSSGRYAEALDIADKMPLSGRKLHLLGEVYRASPQSRARTASMLEQALGDIESIEDKKERAEMVMAMAGALSGRL